MRILFLNQYFPPDSSATAYMLGQLAEDLAEDHQVEVIAGRPSYAASASDYTPRGPSVTRVRSTGVSRETMLGRLANYFSFAALTAVEASRSRRPDLVVAMTDPPFIPLVGALAATRHRAPFVLVYHDVHPDCAVTIGRLRNRIVTRAWRAANVLVRRRAERIVVVGRDMAERLTYQGVDPDKLVYLPNWADLQRLDNEARRSARTRHGWEGRFVVMHAGNVGLAQNVGILAELAERVRGEPEVEIVVLGDGPGKPLLQRAIRERRLDNLTLMPAVPRQQAQALMAAADLHVVTLVPGLWGCAAPSKTYGIMAAGRPFVAAVDRGSEPARLVEEIGCGTWVRAGDADALAEAVLALRHEPLEQMGERGRSAFEERFARELVTAQHIAVLEQASHAGSGRVAPRTPPLPGEISPAARTRAAVRLALDCATAETVDALRAHGVRAILMKGPAISRWLYDQASDRGYGDIDLLVSPGQFDAAAEVLGELGYQGVLPARWLGIRAVEVVEHEQHFVRDGQWPVEVDLHRQLLWTADDPSDAWRLLSADTEQMEVGGADVDVLRPAARAVILALHAAQHGSGFPRALIDLQLAIDGLDPELWRAAAGLADDLGVSGPFATGLRLSEGGSELADRLGLEQAGSTNALLLSSGDALVARALEQLRREQSLTKRARLLWTKVLPSPAYVRIGYPLARKGRAGLLAAYLWRPIRLIARAPRAVRASRTARHRARSS